MTEWKWEDNSVLYNTSPYTPPREIFQAVCNELGRFFAQSGAKYTRSNRKIKWNLGTVRLETAFWSSHSNMAGNWVNLEIVSNVYAIDKSGLEKNGLLYLYIRPNNFNVYNIDSVRFSEITEYISGILEKSRSLNTREGVRRFLAEISQTEERFFGEQNNRVYFDRLPED